MAFSWLEKRVNCRLLFLMLLIVPCALAQSPELAWRDDQAIMIFQNRPTPWLSGEIRVGHADIAEHGESHYKQYIYLHLDHPVNFVAAKTKDNFEADQRHLYDLSLYSASPAIERKLLGLKAGQRISIIGRLSTPPSVVLPTEMVVDVSKIELRRVE